MFGWFRSKPTCPVEPDQRAWLDSRIRWLISEFGLAKAKTVQAILPTPEFFPEPYDATPASGRVLFDRVSRYMGINPRGLKLRFFIRRRPMALDDFIQDQGAAGLYEQESSVTRIQIDEASLADPLVLVATASHELAHVLLLGQGRLTGDEPDHEEITDLLTIYLGFGVFTANSRVRDRSTHTGTSEQWSISRLGYLGQGQVGYALALWARLREEESPSWSGHLCADVRTFFKQACCWLDHHGDGVLNPETGSPHLLSDDELPPGFEKRS
jgi:hypothetical protein